MNTSNKLRYRIYGKTIDKMLNDIEELKDKVRANGRLLDKL